MAISSLDLSTTDLDISKTAHTVCNLLTTLKLNSNQLLYEDNRESLEHYVKSADSTISSAVTAIRHMVLLERISSKQFNPKIVNSDITKTVFDVVDRKRFQWENTNITLHGSRTMKATDIIFLDAVLSELIDNSCSYKSQNVSISVDNSGDRARILIEDDGEGIETKELEQVFDPYFRISKHRKRNRRAGLGLTTAKTIINKLDGDIKLFSHPNWGTKVEILL